MARIFLFAFVLFSLAVMAEEPRTASEGNSVVLPPPSASSPASTPQAGAASSIPGGNLLPPTAPPAVSVKKEAKPTEPSASGVKKGGSFRDRMLYGNDLLKKGDTEGALAQYRDLQTDEPESSLLYYNIGCATYRRGLQETELKAAQDAMGSFSSARASFEKAGRSPEIKLRTEAGFNYANTFAREAEQAVAAGKYEESIKAFQGTVQAYESFLKEHPTHQGAQKNLEYVRYRLKSLMQNPPPPQKQDEKNQQQQDQNQQQQDQKQDPQQDQKQDQDSKSQDPNENEPQKDNTQQKSSDTPNQQDKPESKETEPDQQKQEEKESQQTAQAGESQKDEPDTSSKQEPKNDADKNEHQNMDAIFQSLEDVDKREQKEVRNQRSSVGIRKEWW